MKGKGLSFEVIVEAALRLTKEKGYGRFSARELASDLDVKAASLYNHLNSMDEVNAEIGRIAAGMQNRAMREAAENESRGQAFTDLCRAFRNFAKENEQLYRAILDMPSPDRGGAAMTEIRRESDMTFRKVIDRFDLPEADRINYTRFVRSLLNGFLQMEMAGGFAGSEVTAEESFGFIIRRQLKMLEEAEMEYLKVLPGGG